ncbi:MAG TPA: hypothetical protein V6D27_08935 [Vampirovibrionales bacterium]
MRSTEAIVEKVQENPELSGRLNRSWFHDISNREMVARGKLRRPFNRFSDRRF